MVVITNLSVQGDLIHVLSNLLDTVAIGTLFRMDSVNYYYGIVN